MKYLWQFLIIVAFSFVGELLHFLIPLPIPASIYGIVLLFVALYAHWVQVRQIREVSAFLIAIMPVLFIPSAVGLVTAWEVIRPNLVSYLVITLVSTLVVMGAAGWATQWVWRRHKKQPGEKEVRI